MFFDNCNSESGKQRTLNTSNTEISASCHVNGVCIACMALIPPLQRLVKRKEVPARGQGRTPPFVGRV